MTNEELTGWLQLERLSISLKRWAESTKPKAERREPQDLSASRWAKILAEYPELAEACDCFESFTVYNWGRLLKAQPQFAFCCSSWNQFTPDTWRELLQGRPELLQYCEIPNDPAVRSGLLASGSLAIEEVDTTDFSLADWFWVVKYKPEAWEACPCKKDFTQEMWWSCLIDSPCLALVCPCLHKFDREEWELLVWANPHMLEYYIRFIIRQKWDPSSSDAFFWRMMVLTP